MYACVRAQDVCLCAPIYVKKNFNFDNHKSNKKQTKYNNKKHEMFDRRDTTSHNKTSIHPYRKPAKTDWKIYDPIEFSQDYETNHCSTD